MDMQRLQIPRRSGKLTYTLLDDDDYEAVKHLTWNLTTGNYVVRSTTEGREFLHRRILGLAPQDGRLGDHIDGNPLNNQRSNLRVATRAENTWNSRPARGRPYRGVMHAGGGTYKVVIRDKVQPGRYATKEAAARAWNELAPAHYGKPEFVRLNDVPG